MTGLDVHRVRVEVSITRGTPMIQIVGLAQSAVREGRERIRAAASALGLHLPGLRITVNLAPAGLPKHGAAFDLPMLIGILAAWDELPGDRAEGLAMIGEVGLDGSLRPVRGVLPIAMHAAREADVKGLIVPLANLREATSVDLEIRGAASVDEVVAFLCGEHELRAARHPGRAGSNGEGHASRKAVLHDLSAVAGQAMARRALEIAAAGGHNLLLEGVPGSGKTTLARCLPGILPRMTSEESVEVTAIHSVAGRLPENSGLVSERPFRAPHHTVSHVGLVGGGSIPRPGEASLAHRGVLFLDELPEFGRAALEALRQPLEEGVVHVVRASARATFPARFTLVGAMNPCPCGHAGAPGDRCECTSAGIARYTRRLSGPLLDRVDLRVSVSAVGWSDLTGGPAESSAAVRRRVGAARARSAARLSRFAAEGGTNAELPANLVDRVCVPDREGRELLRLAIERVGLSARGYYRALRVARTIADLDGRPRLRGDDVAEALSYRGTVPP